ncbi:MAG: hypothetical protein Q8J69_10190 [Sphingobacteriaceae bacterium]|nr:hypothetical protein [Sphingobacteriaceae bacterium]
MGNKTILIIALFVAFISCSKEDRKTSVEGRVITFGTETKATNEPLRMGLYQTIVGTGLGTGEKLVDETVTDTNGFYEFSFKPEGNSSYYLRLITQPIAKHFSISYSNQVQLERGIKQKKDYVLHPHAWVKLRLINNGPHFPGDMIRYTIGVGGIKQLNGPVNNESDYLVYGNRQVTISYTVFRGDEKFDGQSVVPFVAAFDTVNYSIEY